MKDKHSIDKLFRDGLGDEGLDYSEEYWAQMESVLTNTKKPFLLRYKWHSLALLLLISAIGYLYNSNNHTKDLAINSSQQVANKTKKSKAENSDNIDRLKIVNSDNDPVVDDSRSEGTNNPKVAISETAIGSNPAILEENDEGSSTFIEETAADSGDGNTIYYPIIPTRSSTKPVLDENYSFYKMKIKPFQNIAFEVENKAPDQANVKIKDKSIGSINYFVSPYIGILNYNKDFNFNTENSYKNSENPINSMEYGINLRIAKGNWSIITGVGTQQLKEETNYIVQNAKYEFDTTLVLASMNFKQRPDGSYAALIVKEIDTTTTYHDSLLCADCPVNFSYVNVPINLQYDLRKGILSYFGRVGVSYGLLRSVNGKYSSGSHANEISELDHSNTNRHHMQLNAALGLKVHINSSLSFQSSYGYSLSTNSMLKAYDQKFRIQQMRFGLEWLISN